MLSLWKWCHRGHNEQVSPGTTSSARLCLVAKKESVVCSALYAFPGSPSSSDASWRWFCAYCTGLRGVAWATVRVRVRVLRRQGVELVRALLLLQGSSFRGIKWPQPLGHHLEALWLLLVASVPAKPAERAARDAAGCGWSDDWLRAGSGQRAKAGRRRPACTARAHRRLGCRRLSSADNLLRLRRF